MKVVIHQETNPGTIYAPDINAILLLNTTSRRKRRRSRKPQ